MTTAGSLQALDLGVNSQFVATWLGPSLGWQLLPVAPELYISTPGALIVPPFASPAGAHGRGSGRSLCRQCRAG